MAVTQKLGVWAHRRRADMAMATGFIAVLLFFVVSGWISYGNIRAIEDDSGLVIHTHEVITALDDLLSLVKDAETGQRGYILTGDPKYLEPYEGAVSHLEERLIELQNLVGQNFAQSSRIPEMRSHINAKMAELAETIALRRTKGFAAAMTVVTTDRGKGDMDALRAEVSLTQKDEQARRDLRIREMSEAYRNAIASGFLTALAGVILAVIVTGMVRRAATIRLREEWLQSGHVGLADAIFGEQRVDQLADNVLKNLCEYGESQVAAFYIRVGQEFHRVAGYGVPENGATPTVFQMGEGLLGQAAKDARSFRIDDVPDGYLNVGSALGAGNPRHLLIAPTVVDGRVNGVLEFGFLRSPDALVVELIDRVAGPIGVALRSAQDRANLQNLLEETQRQSEELQAQSEELRVSNEELEEQSRALKETQGRLEQQQVELEQTNAQLEEQALVLESQRDNLNETKEELERQAEDLERASRYKSDFLANMSHELRTPLNSSLILAKPLAHNPDGHLTPEQVKYARTIQSAGNDLLALISDILDLSKIEAGHMEMDIRRLRLVDLVGNLTRLFEPTAKEKGLQFEAIVDPTAPGAIETDPQRLEQVLKNLLSNAIKFTERGTVSLRIQPASDGRVAFAVSDTGIGIPAHQQEMVFEAFRQADGTTNRKYGGTGLGLSISRELAHLLAGEVHVTSTVGEGSTFTVTIPAVFPSETPPVPGPPRVPVARPATMPRETPNRPIPPMALEPMTIADDRENVGQPGRWVLVVDDDENFAQILFDLAHEHGFQCLIATTAEAALALALQFMPSAVLLDIGLPDHSGLSVLDRLKHDARTRHIPVHVVSGNDYSQTAMALGAIGYMLKPVKREELARAFQMLEHRLTQRLRRVLIVEDDLVQLDSLRLLLGSEEVDTEGVRSAAECLEILRRKTFDCMVLDLSLPDASGFSLLETLSREDGYAFPPVIVYTGRELTAEEEQRLRRYSKSIIVKGAKSPERLLDEVTLFLHQVVADLPIDKQRLLERAKDRDAALEDRVILVVEDDIRNVFALTSVLEPRGARVEIARNGREALEVLERIHQTPEARVDLVLMDIMMPEMDGFTAMREIRKRPEWKRLPIIALTAKAMRNDQEQCLSAGANDYIAKPLDVEKLLSLIRVWMPR